MAFGSLFTPGTTLFNQSLQGGGGSNQSRDSLLAALGLGTIKRTRGGIKRFRPRGAGTRQTIVRGQPRSFLQGGIQKGGLFERLLGGGFGGGGGGGGGFDEIIAGRRKLSEDLLGDLEGFGDSERSRIGGQFDSARNTELARLESRGFGASNLGAAAVGAVEDQRGQAFRDLEDSLIGQRTNLKQSLAEGVFGSQEDKIRFGLERQKVGQGFLGQILGLLR